MTEKIVSEEILSELLSRPSNQNLSLVINTIQDVQQALFSQCADKNEGQPALIKMGTVFQLFFTETLLKKKDLKKLTEDDWMQLVEKAGKYAIKEDQSYCELVFLEYADYICFSIERLRILGVGEEFLIPIKEISDTIRTNAERLKANEIKESAYVEACMWLSFEAMIKLLSSLLGIAGGTKRTRLAQAISQLAFEYGRYVLFEKEHELLKKYLENQYKLDEKLQTEFEKFFEELEMQAEQFKTLISKAFSTDIQTSLSGSVEFARTVGVPEELLESEEEIDAFFLA